MDGAVLGGIALILVGAFHLYFADKLINLPPHWHRALGKFGIALGVLMLVGTAIAFLLSLLVG